MRLATLPQHAAAPASLAPIYALAALLPLFLHLWLVTTGVSPVLDGALVDTDTYMRLVRVTQLYDTGSWFDSVIHRSNAPYGDDLNWTLPLDAILLAGTWILRPWFGFDDALFWTASAIGPLGHLAIAFTAAWAFAPLLPPAGRPLVALGAFTQVQLYFESIAGRADHHGLILTLAIVQAGLMVRVLLSSSGGVRHAAGAGLAAALGIWVSVELLLPLVFSMVALGLAWVAATGRNAARPGRSFAGALTVGLGIAIMVERAPTAYGAIEYDKVSLVHLALAFALAANWTALAALDAQARRPRTVRTRLIALAGIGLACGAVFVGLFPKFLLGPTADVDPVVMDVFLNGTTEMRALWPRDLTGIGDLLANLGSALVALPVLAVLAWRGRAEPQWRAWVLLAALMLTYVGLALQHQRFAPFAAVLALAFVVHGIARLDDHLGRLGAAFRVAAMLGAMLLPAIAAIGLTAAKTADAAASPVRQRCAATDTAKWMAANLADGTIMAHLNQGPVLLYWTRSSVVGGPYHRNRAGIRDGFAFFAATDDRDARRIAAERGVDWVLLCPGEDRRAAQNLDSLAHRLEVDAGPSWLRPVRIPDPRFRLYRVVR